MHYFALCIKKSHVLWKKRKRAEYVLLTFSNLMKSRWRTDLSSFFKHGSCKNRSKV